MGKGCLKHRNGGSAELERLMITLKENQGGAGRHKCPYCAYEEGVKKGIKQERQRIASILGL